MFEYKPTGSNNDIFVEKRQKVLENGNIDPQMLATEARVGLVHSNREKKER